MSKDLDIIKKKYGEKMSHLCRSLFSTLLESDGLLSRLLLDNFNESHYLYDDIVDNELVEEFKDFIYSLVDVEKNNELVARKSPQELMEEAGYILYECKSEDDIQNFKKYYAKGEELCTFKGGRLNKCHVFFAVKKNVDEINRVNYLKPNRQDEYGTSVISIQFTRDSSHTLSIKNRYNHKVNNPDATFSNNLDNIILGLSDSFAKYYGLVQRNSNNRFEIPEYVRASDGKFYKYNYEINNIYYCYDNIIIDHFEVKKYDKSRYLLVDYFIIDLVNKKIKLYGGSIGDSFTKCINDIEKINIKNISTGKKIEIINKDNKKMEINIDKFNRIIGLNSSDIEEIKDNFLQYNTELVELSLPNVRTIGNRFMFRNNLLTNLVFPNLEIVGKEFMYFNNKLTELELPKLRRVGVNFLYFNDELEKIVCPNLVTVSIGFLFFHYNCESILQNIEDNKKRLRKK